MSKSRDLLEVFNKEDYQHKSAVSNTRGAAYALFKYLEAVDDNISMDKTMSDLEKESVLHHVNDLFQKLSKSVDDLKKTLK